MENIGSIGEYRGVSPPPQIPPLNPGQNLVIEPTLQSLFSYVWLPETVQNIKILA